MLRNNVLAIDCAIVFLVLVLVEAELEDNEMARRFGEAYREYMRSTEAYTRYMQSAPGMNLLVGFMRLIRRKAP